MAQPQYAVSSIIGNEKDAVLTQRIEEINQRLMDCPTERGLRNPMQLASEMRETENIAISTSKMNTPNANIPYRLCTALLAVLCIQDVSARCGSVDYSWGADGLAEQPHSLAP